MAVLVFAALVVGACGSGGGSTSTPCATYFAKPVPKHVGGCRSSGPHAFDPPVEVRFPGNIGPYYDHCWIYKGHFGWPTRSWLPIKGGDPCGLNETLDLPNSCPRNPDVCSVDGG